MKFKTSGIVLSVLFIAGLAAADMANKGFDRGDDNRRERMKTELNLTKEQQKKLEAHRIDQRAAMEKSMLTIKEKREELKTALEQPKISRVALQKINDELKDAQNEMADQRLEGILYVRDVLTPEQFKKFLSLAPEMKEHRRKEWKERRSHEKDDRRSDKKGRSKDMHDDEGHDSDDDLPTR